MWRQIFLQLPDFRWLEDPEKDSDDRHSQVGSCESEEYEMIPFTIMQFKCAFVLPHLFYFPDFQRISFPKGTGWREKEYISSHSKGWFRQLNLQLIFEVCSQRPDLHLSFG